MVNQCVFKCAYAFLYMNANMNMEIIDLIEQIHKNNFDLK